MPLDPAQVQPQNQVEAPVLMAKLKAAGVTSVITYAAGNMVSQAMKAATALDYYPEWIFPGLGILDLDAIVRSYDQTQMAHAFGVGTLLVNVADTSDPSNTYFAWYWGPNKGTYQAGVLSYVQTFLTGVMLAGPKLTPQTFQQGLFALPAVRRCRERPDAELHDRLRAAGGPSLRRVLVDRPRLRADVVGPEHRRQEQDHRHRGQGHVPVPQSGEALPLR